MSVFLSLFINRCRAFDELNLALDLPSYSTLIVVAKKNKHSLISGSNFLYSLEVFAKKTHNMHTKSEFK
jgi:hypothetical protein